MRTRPVDERDNAWESDRVYYRLYLFGPEQGSRSTETLDVWDADLLDVLRLAQNKASPERLWALALVETDQQGQRGLRWLTGYDCNGEPRNEREREAYRLMRARLGHTPVTD
ncbi:hypothetical protein [Nocardiopsis valliformis]|uniref:hypothetical protein n=1 Tax=Nocardiopsis valliformis TaxID=239974 RepID=UPI000477A469|nr:hypothetical protein [Nocardiopsis valliformis]